MVDSGIGYRNVSSLLSLITDFVEYKIAGQES